MKKRHKDKHFPSVNKKQQFKTIPRQNIFVGAGSIIISESVSLMISGKPATYDSKSNTIPGTSALRYAYSIT
jgi:hypothetical protein